MLETIALAIAFENVDVMGEPVQECPGEAFRAEDLGPFIEWQVRCDQDRTSLVSLREDFKEEFGAGLGERHEAEFIDDQQLVFGQLALEAQQTLLVPCLHQLVN